MPGPALPPLPPVPSNPAEVFVAASAGYLLYSLWPKDRVGSAPAPPPPPPAADCVVVTGASRGFGAAAAAAIASSSAPSGVAVLTARTAEGLEATARRVADATGGRWSVKTVVADLADGDGLDAAFARLTVAIPPTAKHVVLVNNAGSLGGVTKRVLEMTDLGALREYFELNLVSTIALTAHVLQRVAGEGRRCTVVNVSSLLAVVPFSGYGLYATGKAARDMLHAVLSKEHPASEVKTFNYAPGPLDTQMQTEIRETHYEAEQRDFYSRMKEDGTLLSTEQSAAKLAALLKSDGFESGAHVDFYDLP